MRLNLIGHMTVRIELDGQVFLTDPWFGPRGWLERLLAPRTRPAAISAADVGFLDAVLVSHHHLDHIDDRALDLARRLGCLVIGPAKVIRRARRAGVNRTITLAPGQESSLGSVRIRAVCAQHPLAADAVGFVVLGSQTIYFSGDTRLTPELIADLRPYDVDVALIQAACAHYPLVGDDGMSLPSAAAFARTVRPRWTVPLHLHCAGKWLDRAAGLRIESRNAAQVDEALRRWADALEADGLKVKCLDVGEEWVVPKRPTASGDSHDLARDADKPLQPGP